MITVKSNPKDTVIIQVYMPTTRHEDQEIEEMYEQIEDLMKYVKGDENLIIMWDWNVSVGKGKEGKVLGEHGLGNRNKRGERLIEFCSKHSLVVANTLFHHKNFKIKPVLGLCTQ